MKRTTVSTAVTLIIVAIGSSPASWAYTTRVVSNITVAQRTDGSRLVDIYYDLSNSGGGPSVIEVQASGDGGSTWTLPITALTGDVGPGVLPGTGKHIVWNSHADLPGVVGGQFRIHICADDTPPGMVLIPSGEYLMGDHHDGESYVHAVYIDAFYIDRYEVTNAQYAEALNWAYGQGLVYVGGDNVVYGSGNNLLYCLWTPNLPPYGPYVRITWDGSNFGVVGQDLPPGDLGNKTNYPMAAVSWCGSAAYANWRSAMENRTPSYDTATWECNFAANGYRLPTEAEWEKAARGGPCHASPQDPYCRYPWGDTIDGSQANYWASGDPYESGTTPVGYYDGAQTPPGVDMANGYGLYDMAGNVYEWVNDWYDGSYYSSSPYSNPRGPASGTFRFIRGGAWCHGTYGVRCAFRPDHGVTPDYTDYCAGLRLALQSE